MLEEKIVDEVDWYQAYENAPRVGSTAEKAALVGASKVNMDAGAENCEARPAAWAAATMDVRPYAQ